MSKHDSPRDKAENPWSPKALLQRLRSLEGAEAGGRQGQSAPAGENGWSPRVLLRLDQGGKVFWAFYALAVVAAMLLGGLAGMVFGYALDLPRVDELGDIRPGTVTEIYSADGRVIGQLALEKRILIRYQDIPEQMKDAVLAIEDADFFEHAGIDFQRVLATVVNNIINWERKGASTLTMQLSKLRLTSYERTYERKIKDALYAVEIEKNYSKEQILTFYFNQIYMGHGIYGIATAADFYFSKGLDELTLAESALLAGLIQSPPRYSPINSMERAAARRNIVLGRMRAEGMIDVQQMEEARQEPITLDVRKQDPGIAPYAVEAVRQRLSEMGYNTENIWNEGLRIHTTIDYDMQQAAQEAVRAGLEAFDKERRDWEGAPLNILDQGGNLEEYRHPEWRLIFYRDMLVHGLVLEAGADRAKVRIGSYLAEITPEDIAWTDRKKVDEALKKGDVALFRLKEIDRAARTIKASLDRIPEVQGAMIVLDNRTGAIRAMVGGYDYQYSEFNRATQALRQPGSVFKPFTYVTAFENGRTPLETELDEPVKFLDGLGRPYEPGNSDGLYKGVLTLYQAFGESRNIPTLRLAQKLGMEKVVAVAKRFGIRRNMPPFLPVAIGAGEVTLQEITSALSVFPNQGFRATPFLIEGVEDYEGTLKEEHRIQVEDVVSEDVADKMLFMLRGVVTQPRGTARRALVLGRPIAGKTGTTDDYTDSWFVGITPQVTAGVWVGHDEKKTLGKKVYGSTLALPICIDFYQRIDDKLPAENFHIAYDVDPRDIEYAASPIPQDQEGEPITPTPRKKRRVLPSGIEVEEIPPPPPPDKRNSSGR
ncbi:MAG TPA: PBP1A family penicillin-binding protein [Acidobacteriota bacterium]|nr:PBP1A family penicillin-binding protein [Acidobacteriota bacterium]